MDILEQYVMKYPEGQNIIDLFQGEWSSSLPASYQLKTEPGNAALFDDVRIRWAEEVMGAFKDSSILELGPLEGGHSYMFHNAGAKRVVAIEANARAFLKCLCIKELLQLDKVRFLLGDFNSYLKKNQEKFDMVFASGVLYHMEAPLELLALLADTTDKLFLWTHYYDKEVITGRDDLNKKFQATTAHTFRDNEYEGAVQSYNDALDWSGFCGGPRPVSLWLTKNSLLQALKDLGYSKIDINFDASDHPNGPSLALCAQK